MSPPERPHVGLNLLFLVPGETGGMEVYARELIAALVATAPELRLTAYINREAAQTRDGPWGELIPAVTIPINARKRAEWVRGEQTLLPRRARAVDLLHSLGSTAPATGRFRRITTIHDLHYRTVPDAHFGIRALGMRVLVPLAARRSHRVLADSRSVRDELRDLLGLDPRRIDVVPLGTGAQPRATPLAEAEVRARHRLGDRRIVLSVSAKRPHKNLRRLLDALALIDPDDRPALVLPGYPTPHEDELRAHAAALDLAEDVRFPAWVDEPELEGLYAAADAFVFPSLAEGFGLPVLEAMRRGVPVACSDRGAVAEVAGDAAVRFDPTDPRAIAAAVTSLLTDPDRLREKGRERAASFTWERCARETAASYRRALA